MHWNNVRNGDTHFTMQVHTPNDQAAGGWTQSQRDLLDRGRSYQQAMTITKCQFRNVWAGATTKPRNFHGSLYLYLADQPTDRRTDDPTSTRSRWRWDGGGGGVGAGGRCFWCYYCCWCRVEQRREMIRARISIDRWPLYAGAPSPIQLVYTRRSSHHYYLASVSSCQSQAIANQQT